ncbi:cold-active serine alkaline protease [Nitzschia inconspicua]|uniref:Cold-active serine alkaline protease n=1 Tax=Nitzschia inconspicua TaxID=303405 RepID=A0A9K3LU90_9STRA|nr:cold-active serine alkaline protease [Nitzschia inconspicua]
MRQRSFLPFWLLSLHSSRYLVVHGEKNRKSNLRNSKHSSRIPATNGVVNFLPFLVENAGRTLGNGRKLHKNDSDVGTEEQKGKRMSTQARIGNGFERGHNRSIQQEKPPLNKRKVEVRNLTFQRCRNGGTQFVVQCTTGSEEHCYRELARANAVIVNELPNSDFFVVCVDTAEEKKLLNELTDVVDMEEDCIRTLSYLPELTKPVDRRELQSGQQIPYGAMMVNAPQFWQTKGDKGGSAKVCIIDTGLNIGHEDIQGAVFSGSTDSSVVADWDSDDAGHGTHVAGTIAAVDNNFGVVGVAPEAELLIVKVFEGANSQFTASSLVSALEECRKGGAKIINMSLGGPSSSVVERNKVNQLANQGIQLIAASGNSGDTSNPIEYPASYDKVISVAAVDEDRHTAIFSTHNNEVDVAAPGVDILSLTNACSTCYGLYSGTSMATPHVAGVFALLMSKYPTKSISQIREAIQESASDSGACGIDRMFGHGIVDVMAAAVYLESGVTAPEQNNCINTKITVTTDKWGSETSYIIRNSDGEVVYKNGPYSNQIKTYTDVFQLPDDCYEFELLDSYGDGICCEEGSGSFKVEYDGVEEVYNDSFLNGNSVKASFGCGSGGDVGGGSPPSCGNGILEDIEECDDGNQNNNDSCTNECKIAVCGDGIVGPGEQCDDGNNVNDDACRNDCTSALCGDGVVQSGEECDDGNNSNNDSCTNACKNARCGDAFLQPGEECDDGNGDNGDGCSSDCKVETISTSCQAGEVEVELVFQSDAYSYNENELYFYESTDQTNVGDIDFIWIGTKQGIESNKKYEMSACVDETKCYKFFFFDSYGDGLWGNDGLRLSWNGVEVLSVAPYEVGPKWDGGPAIYWTEDLGACS